MARKETSSSPPAETSTNASAPAQVMKELAQEMEGLTAEERNLLSKSLDDLVRDTPQTPVAATRVKRLLTKAGGAALQAFRDILVDIASETAKKTMMG